VTPIPSDRLIIGIGNAFRSDDGVGIWIVRRLRGQLSSGVAVVEASGEGAALLETWKGFASVILVDAVSSGAAPGTIHRLDAATEPLRAQFFRCSSHAFGVGEAVEMARALDRLPPRLIVYGIEGANFAAGAQISPAVAEAAAEVAERLLAEILARGF
jgi:hydrogenase maturation protease